MGVFASPESYNRFEQHVKHAFRYVHDQEVRDFLATVVATSGSRKRPIPKAAVLWRAQRGYEWRKEDAGGPFENEVPGAYGPERMIPKAEFVGDGRVNPRGIPCLYLASTEEAAMAEVRPWLGSYISLAQFQLIRDISVVDCSADEHLFPFWLFPGKKDEISAETLEKIAWGEISHAFSKPVTPDDPVTQYVPTQVLAEAFRASGFDGIAYKSLLGEGHNVALFDCSAAVLLNCALHETKRVSFTFEQIDNPYFIKKHYSDVRDEKSGMLEAAPGEAGATI